MRLNPELMTHTFTVLDPETGKEEDISFTSADLNEIVSAIFDISRINTKEFTSLVVKTTEDCLSFENQDIATIIRNRLMILMMAVSKYAKVLPKDN